MRRFLVAALFAGLAPFVTAKIMRQTSTFDDEIRQQMLMKIEELQTHIEPVQGSTACETDCTGTATANQDYCGGLDISICLSAECAECGCLAQGPMLERKELPDEIICIKS